MLAQAVVHIARDTPRNTPDRIAITAAALEGVGEDLAAMQREVAGL
jgi:hypothetical protein